MISQEREVGMEPEPGARPLEHLERGRIEMKMKTVCRDTSAKPKAESFGAWRIESTRELGRNDFFSLLWKV